LTEPRNSLVRQYKKLFELEGIQLTMDDEVLDFMVEKAVEYKLGARGLRSICESILTDAMFELPSTKENKFHLTLEYAQKKFDTSKMSLLKVA
jgi:ATP-dependent Clp protease ATP-binding subunit ClpX